MVNTVDVRGHAESDWPTDQAACATEKLVDDALSVVDACGGNRFILWAMSHGGKLGRCLAARSERVTKAILIGPS
jgi:pimeloyl-ACP methyl ester carboxylesterase